METEQKPIIQACYINGEICRNGKRDDFKIDPLTHEKYHCNKWIKLIGPDPQTGRDIDTWCCNEFAKIKLQLENAMIERQVKVALDRNNNTLFSAFPDEVQQRIAASNPNLLNGKNHD